jgi:hypothetical protein
MLPCPFPRELPLSQHPAKRRAILIQPDGRGSVGVTRSTQVPEPRYGLVSRPPRNGSGVLKTPPTRALSLGLTSRRTFPARPPRSAASPDNRSARPATLHTACELGLYTQLAARLAPRTPRQSRARDGRSSTGDPRPGAKRRDADHSEPCSVVFVPSLGLPDCPAKRPRSHSKGSTSLIA